MVRWVSSRKGRGGNLVHGKSLFAVEVCGADRGPKSLEKEWPSGLDTQISILRFWISEGLTQALSFRGAIIMSIGDSWNV